MSANGFMSGIGDVLDRYVAHRRAGGGIADCTVAHGLRSFDRMCGELFPGESRLLQGMVDRWCTRRPGERADSLASRTGPVRSLVAWARERGLTTASVPAMPRREAAPASLPHHFTRDELERFFEACDTMPRRPGRLDAELGRITCPALFRLLYSSGMRTTEARLLARSDVDLAEGVVDVRRTKGGRQHYVALHGSMTDVLRAFDGSADRLVPGRSWFFQSPRGGPYSSEWLSHAFARLWGLANGGAAHAVAYHLRHNYAVENVTSWGSDPFSAGARLLWLSKSMGHAKAETTLYYYHLTPLLADKLLELTGADMDRIIPDVWEEGRHGRR